jgi:hypothetical protein
VRQGDNPHALYVDQYNYLGYTVNIAGEIDIEQSISTIIQVNYSVPEPYIWIEMILGFFLLGFMVRLKSKETQVQMG